ncbi:hypothetical protein [Paenibacillus agilis]|uniref:Uncharacterized protein n=1 Tax=Paenibacillus agilis TaxID=3020863 RepID=A0A559ID45_9BACL|nr:hypothetical protein [Paenibacillus agilis]TVX85597.1 hypothetical protein FPZ44_24900 [Paenibacillus agilis]
MNKKLERLIDIAAELEVDTSRFSTSHARPESHCRDALIQALRTVTNNTQYEMMAEDIIKTCEKHFYKERD